MNQQSNSIPIALTIAGSDSSAGAGIQADLKTFSALGVYGASVITSLTAQNTQGVQKVYIPPYEIVGAQLDSVYSDLGISAVKIGMVGDGRMIETVIAGLNKWNEAPLVVDPVMVATSGDILLSEDAINILIAELFPLADLITPNLPEAAKLLSQPIACNSDEMSKQAEKLLEFGAASVLIKGGHGTGDEAVDVYVDNNQTKVFRSPRIKTRNTHGTGCTLSSAIAANLAKGEELITAIASAKNYVSDALAAAGNLDIGKGPGPVHHFYKTWN